MIGFHHPLIALFIIPTTLIMVYYFRKTKNIFLILSKLLIIHLIILALSSPYITAKQQNSTISQEITIISDQTDSMRLFNNVSKEVYNSLNNKTNLKIDIISGNKSPIGDHIIQNLKNGNNILLISDGNNNAGTSLIDAINFAHKVNSTIYSISLKPQKKDIGVYIESDNFAISNTPVKFIININNIGNSKAKLNVYIDDRIIYTKKITDEKQIVLSHSFNNIGSHKIKAELIIESYDEFPQNNIFFKTIHVFPKQKVLLLSSYESPLYNILTESYLLDISTKLEDVSKYKAIVLDDIKAEELSDKDTEILSDYVVNGKGLVIFGGENAYKDYYKKPLFEQLIPVKIGGKPPKIKKSGIVILIDISGSTGDFSENKQKIDIEKGIAIQILDNIGRDDYIGIIAFNNMPHTVVPISKYSDNSFVKDKIKKLKYGGTTRLSSALNSAYNNLKDLDAGKNIILISDGKIDDVQESINTAKKLADKGIKVYTIGIGRDTDENFMKELASMGNGVYLKLDQINGIKLLFRDNSKNIDISKYPLLIIDNTHFITKNLEINATVYGYNNVYSKQNAKTLIMTSNGNPIITTWKFGLGRVISVTTDNGNFWASELYNKFNSKAITRTINYAIGSPEQKIIADDTRIGEPVIVKVVSDKAPLLYFDDRVLEFQKINDNIYSAMVFPNKIGFHDISGYTIAVNPSSEYQNLGVNKLMNDMIKASGGKVYNVSEIQNIILDIMKKNEHYDIIELKPMILFFTLIIYVFEIIFRRVIENLKN